MPYQQASLRYTSAIELEIADLTVHLPDRLLAVDKVIRSIGVFPGILGIAVFYIGHIDINYALQQPDGAHAFVAAAVVNYGNLQATFDSDPNALHQLGNKMRGGYQVYVMAAHVLQLDHAAG
ncbi:MAG: hypothetical protein DDT28_00346 [Dehalococcoidia bacterium]|nr:hypothetical protein [Chloroflexota bacterium]